MSQLRLRANYSPAEREVITRLYPTASKAEVLAAMPGRTWEGVCSAASRYGIARLLPANYARAWSAAHEALLREHYPTRGATYVAGLVDRLPRTVLSYAGQLGIRRDYSLDAAAGRTQRRPPRSNDWTKAERELLAAMYPTASQADIVAAFPSRSWIAIGTQAAKQRVFRAKHLTKPWSPEEEAILRANYPTRRMKATAAMLPGRSCAATRKHACLLGIRIILSPAKLQQKREKIAKVKVAKEKKVAKAKVVKPEPIKRLPATPVLNARAEAKRRADKARDEKPKAFVSAAEIKALGANHPARIAYTRAAYHGPAAATAAFHEAMQQHKQAA